MVSEGLFERWSQGVGSEPEAGAGTTYLHGRTGARTQWAVPEISHAARLTHRARLVLIPGILGIPDEAFEEESKKFHAAGIDNLGQLGKFAARELENTVRIITLRSLARFLRPSHVSPTLNQVCFSSMLHEVIDHDLVSFSPHPWRGR